MTTEWAHDVILPGQPGPTLVVLWLAVQFSIRIMSLQMCWLSCVIKYYIYLSLGHGRLSTGGSLWEPPAPLSHSTQSVIRQPKRSVLFHIALCHDIFTINAIFVISNAALNTIWRHTSDWKTVKGSWRLQTCWELIWRESLQKHQNHDELQQM